MRFDIFQLNETGSTNDDVKKAAEAGVAEGMVVWALSQKSGKGRLGRAWESPQGNLYFSVLLRPPRPKRAWGHYSFAAGVAIAETVGAILPDAKIELKWPNDVLVNGKKICGILLEGGEGWLVIGMGINVASTPKTPLYPTTSLAAEGATALAVEGVLNGVLDRWGAWYEKLNKEGFEPVRAEWLKRARRGVVRVRLPGSGQEELAGAFVDLDEEGNLVMRLEDGTERRIAAGDVIF